MNNLKMKIAGFKSECLILCKDAKKGDEIFGYDQLISLFLAISRRCLKEVFYPMSNIIDF